MKQKHVEIKNVYFSYGADTAQLKGVNLSVAQGEFIVLTGESGCGKTTLTRLINGLIPHFYEGELTGGIFIDGKNTHEFFPWEFGKRIGSIFQDPRSQFFASVTADELAFACENYGLDPAEIRKRVETSANHFRIHDLLKREMLTLSGGEKQKVAAASAYAMRPAIYVMDEPSANLDTKATAELAGLLKQLKEAGNTIIIAEHRLYYLTDMADRFIYLKEGEIRDEYTVGELSAIPDERRNELGLRTLFSTDVITANKSINHTIEDRAGPYFSAGKISVKTPDKKKALLHDVSFSISAGEIVALVGDNGVGKTTLARTICGLNKESGGNFLFSGEQIKPSKRYKHAWYVMQDTDCQLFSDSVLHELLIGTRHTEEAKNRAWDILEQLELLAYIEKHPASLSGGQKQRLALAVALMQNTDLVVLDEPTSGLDKANMNRVAGAIKKAAASGKAFLIITHDHELTRELCTRVIMLQDGDVVDSDSRAARPAAARIEEEMSPPRPAARR